MNQQNEAEINLMDYAHGAGCGCKIAPSVLQQILRQKSLPPLYESLLVGNDSNDDAAVFQLNEDSCLISTTDFFTPIVNDAELFGRIAAANALSDVYAMGGKPLMAISILGFPVEMLPVSLAGKMMEGARQTCDEAKIPIAGGHSIDSKEPIFGLAVTGIVSNKQLKRNNRAREGNLLLLTKPIGTGILSSASKRKKLLPEHYMEWIAQMTRLNDVGTRLATLECVTAMTDITGFGLLGHLQEVCEGSQLSAELYYDKVPILASAKKYASEKIIPDATYRNWNAYSAFTQFSPGVNVMEAFNMLPDPQTNGGLLIAVKENNLLEAQQILMEEGYEQHLQPIGRLLAKAEKTVYVK